MHMLVFYTRILMTKFNGFKGVFNLTTFVACAVINWPVSLYAVYASGHLQYVWLSARSASESKGGGGIGGGQRYHFFRLYYF